MHFSRPTLPISHAPTSCRCITPPMSSRCITPKFALLSHPNLLISDTPLFSHFSHFSHLMTGWDYPGIEPSSIDGVIFDLPQVKIPTTLFPICGDPISPICQKIMFFCSPSAVGCAAPSGAAPPPGRARMCLLALYRTSSASARRSAGVRTHEGRDARGAHQDT